MNRKELALFTDLIRLSTSIQTLYSRLYKLEISNQKNTEKYSRVLETLDDAIEIEINEYYKNRKNVKEINNLINFINNPIIGLEMPKSLFDKTTPLARIYYRLIDLTYDIDYQRNCYRQSDIKRMEEYDSFESIFNALFMQEYQECFMKKEFISGMFNRFSKMTHQKRFNTSNIVEQKYLYSCIFSYIEPVLISSKFSCDYEYPLMLKEADYLMVDRELYDSNKKKLLLKESGRVMTKLLYESQDKIPYLMDKSYFIYIIDSLSLEELAELENSYNSLKDSPLNGYKFNINKFAMVKKLINNAIDKRLEEYDLTKYCAYSKKRY